MRIHQPVSSSAFNPSLYIQYVRTLAAIILLVGVWYLLFVWGLVMTEGWLARWDATPNPAATWQVGVAAFLHNGIGLYMPASGLVLISLALFFYRTPRSTGRLYVPVEFAWSTLLFLSINQLLFRILHGLAASAPMVGPEAEMLDVAAMGREPATLFTELGWGISILMLLALFWMQGSGVLHLKRRQRPLPEA